MCKECFQETIPLNNNEPYINTERRVRREGLGAEGEEGQRGGERYREIRRKKRWMRGG